MEPYPYPLADNVTELAKNRCPTCTASRKESLRHFLNEEIKNHIKVE